MKKQRIVDNWQFWKEGNESAPQKISLPHDAMICERRRPDLESGSASGFFPGGKYVYVRSLYGREEWKDKAVILEFEGVYMNASVWLNGEYMGGWIYGYTNFYIDLTGKLKTGEENELKVIADNSRTPNSRWYTGSGIYRPVNLWVGEPNHILPEGVRIQTVSTEPAVIRVRTDWEKNGEETPQPEMRIGHSVIKDGKCVVQAEGEDVEIVIPDGALWDAENPNLYTLRTVLEADGRVIDEAENIFGIRTLSWDADKGLRVNGKTVKLRGGCLHHDHGILGACAYDRSEYRRIRIMKEFGFNAVRSSHNPAGKNLLEACDRLGMYVVDETFDQWHLHQSKYDYAECFDREWEKDVTALVSKDYNHPSVIMYSIGNEITDTGVPGGEQTARMLTEKFHSLDRTRPVTLANNALLTVLASLQAEKQKEEKKSVGSGDVNEIVTMLPKISASITPEKLEALAGGCFDAVDVVGYNYGQNLYAGTHAMKPDRVILSSETFPRSMADNWKWVAENDYVTGDFMWTAWDYLGEAGIGQPVYGTTQAPFSKTYPCLTAACGSMDLTGYPESQAYYGAVIWGIYRKPYIAVRPPEHFGEEYTLGRWRLTDALHSWTWEGQEGKMTEIVIYSIGKEVELFQDGISLGRMELKDCRADFRTVYRPGRLLAVSYDEGGSRIAEDEIVTAGEKTVLRVLPEEEILRADRDEIVHIPVHVTDEKGLLKMQEERKITVTVKGPGELIAVGSGRPVTEEGFRTGWSTSWHGRILAVVRSTGEEGTIEVTAQTEGLEPASASVCAVKPA